MRHNCPRIAQWVKELDRLATAATIAVFDSSSERFAREIGCFKVEGEGRDLLIHTSAIPQTAKTCLSSTISGESAGELNERGRVPMPGTAQAEAALPLVSAVRGVVVGSGQRN